jgi:CxxC motif-containing protein (DUF1111 family)
MKKGRVAAAFLSLVAASLQPALADTITAAGREAFTAPFIGLSRQHRREFFTGDSFFNDQWVSAPASAANRDGLGPLFHARSCSGCHVKDGRGAPPSGDEVMTGLLLRLSAADGMPDKIYGSQLAVRALPGVEPEGEVTVKWIETSVTLTGGEIINLRRPEIKVTRWNYGQPDAGLALGPRLAPAVFGGGLLEAVEGVGKNADPDDKNHDGISGRMNMVVDRATKEKVPGRFGWKANMASLRDQAAAALAGDMGITTAEHPDGEYTPAQAPKLSAIPNGGKPEADLLVMDRLESYLRGLGAPGRRNTADLAVQRGEALFKSLNCAACHLPEMRTGNDHAFKELHGLTIHPFTDLLIHDMGPDLADGRPDGEASGSEWRTAPLWGLGLNNAVNGNVFLLHDGRARTPTEAILWHGGEAEASRNAFKALEGEDRAALIKFLESL